MIKFKNGHEMTFACGSGALAFTGKGWWWEAPFRWAGKLDPTKFTVVAKTITVQPAEGNLSMWHPWTCVALIGSKRTGEKGATNAIGLTNRGVDYWIDRQYPVAMNNGYKIAASIKMDSPAEADIFAAKLGKLKLAYIEANPSCPNVENEQQKPAEMLKRLQHSGHPIVLKLSWEQVQDREFIESVDGYVDAYHAINTVPWNYMFPNRDSPIERYPHGKQGGVSGTYLRRYAQWAVKHLKSITAKPVIGGGGIFCLDDVTALQLSGADAFSIGTCFLYYPWRPNRIIDDYEKFIAGPMREIAHTLR